MDDRALVGGLQAFGDLDREVDGPGDVEGLPADHRSQRFPFEQLHHDERTPVVFADLVDGADARVVQRGRDAGFAPHAIDGVRMIGEVGGQQLQRDGAMEPDVLGPIHDAHATAAELLGDAVMGNNLTVHRGKFTVITKIASDGLGYGLLSVGANLQARCLGARVARESGGPRRRRSMR